MTPNRDVSRTSDQHVTKDVRLELLQNGQIERLGNVLAKLNGDVLGTSWGAITHNEKKLNRLLYITISGSSALFMNV